ncbi:Hypothetical predicted protein [Olea europaea subsp. europaea]|uniref:Uncharacterized protein n=1 Tax=Olea europaea subsp. europaea TaxID=158383 RepID=A0A8S0TWB2_OLEEU|nr:Hypothetical predicted protein [Olea europaea subsp. europaea]
MAHIIGTRNTQSVAEQGGPWARCEVEEFVSNDENRGLVEEKRRRQYLYLIFGQIHFGHCRCVGWTETDDSCYGTLVMCGNVEVSQAMDVADLEDDGEREVLGQ